jgi:hypothetical protein
MRCFHYVSVCRLSVFLGGLLALFWIPGRADTPPSASGNLAFVETGIQSAEDAPFVPADYRFMPGDWIYFTFQVSGFKVAQNGDTEVRQISLRYTVEPVDGQGVPLAQAVSDAIDQEISPQDKNWQPKRRASFLLPSYISAGTYQLRVTVDDLLAKTSASKMFPFQIGGTVIAPAAALNVQSFRFLRDESDGPALEVAAYRPGDTVWGRFDMAGFRTNAQHAAELEYGFSVLRPNGKPVFEEKTAAKEVLNGLFYPPQFVPGVLSVNTTRDLAPGEYTIVVRVRDLIGKQSAELQEKFRIE